MALKPLQTTGQPLGQFDGLDSQFMSLKGGEVVTLVSSLLTALDKAAADALDGYTYPSAVRRRPLVTSTLSSGNRPLMLADDGIAGYGTLFGSVIGTVCGVSSTATVLGPHSAAGSGKVTCWATQGVFGVSLDSMDTTAATGVTTSNTTLDTGSALYATSAGLITANSSASFQSGIKIGTFIDFVSKSSLVTTSSSMTSALNSPHNSLGSTTTIDWAVIYFNPPTL